MRYFLIFAALPALLSACAPPEHSPETPETGCARSPADGEKDGGLGGTGSAPDPCDAEPVVE